MFTLFASKPHRFSTCLLIVFSGFAAFCLEAPAGGESTVANQLSPFPAKHSENVVKTGPTASDLCYRIAKAHGISHQTIGDHYVFQSKGATFKVTLVPKAGKYWNMESISVLGLKLKNTGNSELVLDLMLSNEGATGWSNSALGRTIVKAGEEIPLALALCRSANYKVTDPAYLRMSGKPNGNFRHWHTFDAAKVKNLIITCPKKGDHAFELQEMFPLQEMNEALMGVFPFIDTYGQYMLKDWPDKIHSNGDFAAGIAAEKKLEAEIGTPTGFSKYGGWKEGPKLKATGFFRTEKHEGRWWFVDPEGYLFWSYGVTCVGVDYAGQTPTERTPAVFQNLPAKDDKELGQFHTELDVEDNYVLMEDVPHYDFTRANLYRKYGDDWARQYIERDIERLKYCNLNTIGAWSDNKVVAQKQVPYTAMLHYEYAFAAEKLPDPFAPETRAGLRKALREYPVPFKDDPWCLGAFVNNELHWKNNSKHLVAAVLGWREKTAVKKVFRDWLKEKYTTVDKLNDAWETSFSGWEDLLKVTDASMLKKADASDCSALSSLLADAFFSLINEELENYSPNTLYLGSRLNSGCREVLQASAEYADVISANIYAYHPNPGAFGSTKKPVLISEFHYANTGGSNLGGGLSSAQSAEQQGRLFRAFMAAAVDHPQIVGAHWFQWRDQNVGGRYDGENYDVGFFDVTDTPNNELVRAASELGRNLYNSIK